ncbi:hypothetical protein P692DRAFT_201800752 [Suillus brevipes Sb2]|nr:hypothetical protein P692DRAFT_201800752 [Suillus brevipes Sb2]
MIELRKAYPNTGTWEIVILLFHEKEMSVSRWLQFGLALHTGVEPFSGHIMWIRVWHSNRNPQLILTYYVKTTEKLGYIPMVTQSNLSTENDGIANAYTMLRQMYDPALQGTL